jgi:hypothetical protein
MEDPRLQEGEADEVLGRMNSSQAKLDPRNRFRPTATQPSALKGPERVPYKARITPTPYMKARARPTARPPGESAASRASQVVRPVAISPSPNQRAM